MEALSDQETDLLDSYKTRERLGGNIGSMLDQLKEEKWSELVDMIVQAHNELDLIPDLLFRAVHNLGRYISTRQKNEIVESELELVVYASMYIAVTYADIYPPKQLELLERCKSIMNVNSMLAKMPSIMEDFDWCISYPTTYHFLALFNKVGTSYKKMEDMVFFLAELGMMHYEVIVMRLPSMFAASALYAARCTLKEFPVWNETLECLTDYSESNIKELAKLMVRFHSEAANQDLKAVYNKYSDQKWSSVAFCEPAKDLLED